MAVLWRRIFLISVLPGVLFVLPSLLSAGERRAEVTIQVNLNAPVDAKNVRLWIPYPLSGRNQDITEIRIAGNYSSSGVYRTPRSGDDVLFAEWKEPGQARTLAYSFTASRRELVTKGFPQKELPLSQEEFREYLKPAIPVSAEGKVKDYALKIPKGKKTVLARARAVYDWIVDNMHRDPNVKGCGLGDVEKLLVTMGGKCADIHSVFVALSRSAGVPAREVFGIRIPKGKEGDMTKSQHCWAEFYLPGYGWVVVDPADVRKMILEKGLTLDQAKEYREYYFGAVDENRIAFGTGRNITLNPPQSGVQLNYFMYPYAEADGKQLNEDLYGFNIGYKISFKEL
jgi:transglutaminase-like putative cysteine protease